MQVNNQYFENSQTGALSTQVLRDLLESAKDLKKNNELNQKELRQIEQLCQLCQLVQNNTNHSIQLGNFMDLIAQTEAFQETFVNKKNNPQKHQAPTKLNPNQSPSEMISQINEILSIGISCLEDVMTILKLIRNIGGNISENLLMKFQEATSDFLLTQAQTTESLEDFLALFTVIKEFLNELNIEIENEEEISNILSIKHGENNQNKDSVLDARAMGLHIEDISQDQDIEQPDSDEELLNFSQAHLAPPPNLQALEASKNKNATKIENQSIHIEKQHRIEKNLEIDQDKKNKKPLENPKKLKEATLLILQDSQDRFISTLMNELTMRLSKQLNL